MATTSDTAAQTARGSGMNELFTSKNLTPVQRRSKRVIIGIWVVVGYGSVCTVVGIDPWTIWRLYGGLAALGLPLLVLVFWFPVVLGVVAVACASGLEVRRSVVVGQAQQRAVAPRSTPWARGGHVDPVGGRVRLAVLPDPLRPGLAFGNGAPRGRHVPGFPGG